MLKPASTALPKQEGTYGEGGAALPRQEGTYGGWGSLAKTGRYIWRVGQTVMYNGKGGNLTE